MKLRIFSNIKSERTKILIKNSLGSFCIKGFSLIASTFSMPLYMKYFNNNLVLGVWYTLLAVLNWINMFDFGLTNGMRNELVDAIEKKDINKISKLFVSTLCILCLIALVIFLGGLCICYASDFNQLLNVPRSIISSDELKLAASILLMGVAVSFCLKTITALFYALQKPVINNFVSLISSIIPLLVIIITQKSLTTLTERFILMSVVHVLVSWIPLLIAFFIERQKNSCIRKIEFSRRNFEFSVARRTLSLGGSFFVVQAAFLIITQSNEILITKLFSPDYVVQWRAYNTIFLVIGTVLQVGLSPIWSSVTQAQSHHDYEWLKKLRKILYFIAAGAFLMEFLVAFCFRFLLKLWLGNVDFEVHASYVYIFALYGGVYILNIIVTTLANGLGKLKIQLIFYGGGALVKIPCVLLLRNTNPKLWISVTVVDFLVLGVFCIAQIISFERHLVICEAEEKR